ncbi:MAG: MOP flippase family protein [Komarekiella atlantica HA4396-MV6]|jgi:PST family polysaccharide transporter|nr:MOP flippase family protein [Komarekiella atlantica HA4396-MV6]
MESPKESSSFRQKAIRGVVWSAIQNWGRQAIAFIVFFLLARLLGPKAFGLVAAASIFLGLIGIFLDQGFSAALIQRKELEPEHLDTAFWTNISIGLIMTVLSMTMAGGVANFFKLPELTPVIRWLSLSFIITSLSSTQEAIFQRKLDFKPLAVRELVGVSASGLVGVTMAYIGFGIWSLVSQQLVNGLVRVLLIWWASDWRPRLSFSYKHFRELFSFGINVVGINLLSFISTRSDNLLIAYFLGPVALGYYTIAYRLLEIVTQLFIGVITPIALPLFSRLQQDIEKTRLAFYRAVQLSNFIGIPIFLGLSALSSELVIVVFGEKWISSIPVMQILNLIGILYTGFYFNGPVMMAVGKSAWKLRLDFIKTIGYFLAFAIAVRWGIVAVAAGYVITGYLMSGMTLWFLKKTIRINLITYLQQYIAPMVGSVAMVAAILGTKYFLSNFINLPILLLISILVGAIVYPVTIILIAPKEFRQFIDVFRSFLPQSVLKIKN